MPTSLDTRAMGAALQQCLSSRVEVGKRLTTYGTFGVGGIADVFVKIKTEDEALAVVRLARERDWPLLVVGKASNVLFADDGVRGIVARMNIETYTLEMADDKHTRLVAGAGVDLPKLANVLAARGLVGFEWGIGVPGTIGGAIVSNAGARGACTGDTVQSARVLLTDAEGGPTIETLPASALELAYRHSRFRADRATAFGDDGLPVAPPRATIEPREVILGATFLLPHDDPKDVQAGVREHRAYRAAHQPPRNSAGSVFKNPKDNHSGQLIERAGLKGHRVGQAEISEKHANFIVNNGGATATEVVHLIALARRTVRERFGVELELEVELRGEW